MSLSDIFISILTNHSRTNSVRQNTYMNNSFNIRNTYLYKFIYLYNIFFFINSIKDIIIKK